MVTSSTVRADDAAGWASRAAGHVEEYPHLPGHGTVCLCGWVYTGSGSGFDEWWEHIFSAGTAELERRGLLAPRTAGVAARLLGPKRSFVGSLAELRFV